MKHDKYKKNKEFEIIKIERNRKRLFTTHRPYETINTKKTRIYSNMYKQ